MDVIVPFCEKDLPVLSHCVTNLLAHAQPPLGRVLLVSASIGGVVPQLSTLLRDDKRVHWVPEMDFPITVPPRASLQVFLVSDTSYSCRNVVLFRKLPLGSHAIPSPPLHAT